MFDLFLFAGSGKSDFIRCLFHHIAIGILYQPDECVAAGSDRSRFCRYVDIFIDIEKVAENAVPDDQRGGTLDEFDPVNTHGRTPDRRLVVASHVVLVLFIKPAEDFHIHGVPVFFHENDVLNVADGKIHFHCPDLAFFDPRQSHCCLCHCGG